VESVEKDFEIASNVKNHSCIRGKALFKHPTMHLIRVPKIQMGTRMTRMLRSADLFLSTGELGLRQKNEGFFSQRRRGAKVFEVREIWKFGNLEIRVMCSFILKKTADLCQSV